MKVYLVTKSWYDDYQIVAVCGAHAVAEKVIRKEAKGALTPSAGGWYEAAIEHRCAEWFWEIEPMEVREA